ncbi:MAG: hypothetical protein LBK47_01265 [Prevotellaceae bacterium]|jgi:hypothetical protein|nr:hypothetical protein [Prevotellaceae bacterium]
MYNLRAKKLAVPLKSLHSHRGVLLAHRALPRGYQRGGGALLLECQGKSTKNNHPNYTVLYQLLKQAMDDLEKFELSLINHGRELTPALLAAYKKSVRRAGAA